MDLTKFTQKTIEYKEEIIIDNEEIKIKKKGDKVIFLLKKKEAMLKYKDFMFFSPTNAIIAQTNEEAECFFQESLNEGVEGLMFKNLNSTYKPGMRAGSMAKLKETKEDIDVVIVGAEHGKGKRAGYYTSFFVAVKNDEFSNDEDNFLIIGKVSSGIKELGEEGASMDKLTQLLKPIMIKEEKGVIWVEPKVVIQVRYQEIQKSTTYNSGFALRFPRIISLREDKPLEEINSIEDIERFSQQIII